MQDAITITDPTGRLAATFVPSLGMIGTSLLHDGEELLAQLRGEQAYIERHKVFALPLLYPWANRLSDWGYEAAGRRVSLDRDDPHVDIDVHDIPIHGLLAACPDWRVESQEPDALTAALEFDQSRPYFPAFPFKHRIEYAARVTQEGARLALSVRVTVLATGSDTVPISFGFHPYLTLPGSDRYDWQITLPVVARARLDAKQIPTGEKETLAPGQLDGRLGAHAFDDSFPELISPSGAVFAAEDDRRRVTLEHREGYPVSQVYSPAGAQFICFEPMTAPVNALREHERLPLVAPGESFSAEFMIGVEGR